MVNISTIIIFFVVYIIIAIAAFIKVQEVGEDLNFWKSLSATLAKRYMCESDCFTEVCIHCGGAEQINGQIVHTKDCPIMHFEEKTNE